MPGLHRVAGLLACAWGLLIAAVAQAQEAFTLAVIPDTQMEVLDAGDTRMADRMRWLVQQREALNIPIVLHVGDMVNWDTPEHEQFRIASEAFEVLDEAGLPYVIALGNHDTAAVKVGGSAAPGNVNLNLRNTATFNRYFPLERFKRLAGVHEEGKIDNACHTFSAGGLDWLVINLELWAREEAIEWARGVVESHPNHNIILLTHAHLTGKDEIHQTNGGYGNNSPQLIFDRIARPFPNVKLILSGHWGTHGYRRDDGADGNVIHQFRQCYHDRQTNPVRLLRIDPAAGTITSRVYCPSTGQDKDDGSTMTVRDVRFVQPAAAPSSR